MKQLLKEIFAALLNLFFGAWTAISISGFGICGSSATSFGTATFVGIGFFLLLAFGVPFLSVGTLNVSVFSSAICYSLPIFLFSFEVFPNHPYLSVLIVGGSFTVMSYAGARIASKRNKS